jgi:hypothetical protein
MPDGKSDTTDCVALARAAADRCETVCGLQTCSCASDVRRAADEIERLREDRDKFERAWNDVSGRYEALLNQLGATDA